MTLGTCLIHLNYCDAAAAATTTCESDDGPDPAAAAAAVSAALPPRTALGEPAAGRLWRLWREAGRPAAATAATAAEELSAACLRLAGRVPRLAVATLRSSMAHLIRAAAAGGAGVGPTASVPGVFNAFQSPTNA